MEGAKLEERSRLIRKDEPVDHWLPEDAVRRRGDLLRALQQRCQDFIARLRTHARDNIRWNGAAESGSKGITLCRPLDAAHPSSRRIGALDDGPVEEPCAPRRDEVEPDTRPSCRRAPKGHVVRISTEPGDVVPHPDEGRPLVEQTVIAG